MNVTAAVNGTVNASSESFVQQLYDKVESVYVCQQDLLACGGNALLNKISSMSFESFKWGAYHFPNGVASLPGLGYSLAKWGFNKFVCPDPESSVCNVTRIVGRKIQDVSSAKFTAFENWATNTLAPNAANDKFSALNIIAPAIFAGFCARKSLENLNNGFYHAYQLASFQRNRIETAAGGHTHIDNRSSAELGWAVFIESLLAAGWGFGTYVTSEAIQDALKNNGVPNAELLAPAFVAAAFVAPTAWRWTNDALFKGRTDDPTHFDSATATPKKTREAMDQLDPSGQFHNQLDPFAPTPTSSEESDGE